MKLTNEGNYVQLEDKGTIFSFIYDKNYNNFIIRANGKNKSKRFCLNISDNNKVIFDYFDSLFNSLYNNYQNSKNFPCERQLLNDIDFYNSIDNSFKYCSENLNIFDLDKNSFIIRKIDDTIELVFNIETKSNSVIILGAGNGSSYPYKYNQPLRDLQENLYHYSTQKRLSKNIGLGIYKK